VIFGKDRGALAEDLSRTNRLRLEVEVEVNSGKYIRKRKLSLGRLSEFTNEPKREYLYE